MEMRLLTTASTGTSVPYSPHRFFVSRNAAPFSRCSNFLLKPRLGSLSLLLPARARSRRSIGPRLGARVSAGDEVEDSILASGGFPQPISVKIPFGDRHILVEIGHMGRQASGAVTVTDGETIIYTTVCLAEVPSEPSDFFPLSVTYQERFSAAGRTSGGFFKREGKTKDHEVVNDEAFMSFAYIACHAHMLPLEDPKILRVLICRLIDRPLRPTMMKGFYHETQVLSWVLSFDGLHSPDCLAVTAAGIAVALSEVPNSKTIAGVRVGFVGDKFIVNPTTKQMEESDLDLVLAGTDSAILMIEGYCNFLSEEKLLEAVKVGQEAVQAICKEVDSLVKICGKPKMLDAIKLPPPELYKHVEDIAGEELVKVLQIRKKIPRRKSLSAIEDKVLMILTEKGYVSKDESFAAVESIPDLLVDEDEDEEVVVDGEIDEGDVHIKPHSRKSTPLIYNEVDVKLVFKEVTSKYLRRRIVEGSKRSDGRNPYEIRPINSKCGLLPRAHGSALFTRGETQSLAVVTLGDKQMAQRVDNLTRDDEMKRFYLQYTFPPSSVGEVGRIGAPSRREIGHGTLAERSLAPVLPSEEDFPYTIRVESTITESNGSSSMASVCGGCLALQDAGVPIKSSIAGIAMGMVLDTLEFGGDGTPLILSDITGSEDASGDMDFKVAGNEDGVTAFQLDIKVGGITLPIMRKALLQAKEGRKHILAQMLNCSPPPSKSLSRHAPLILVMKVNPEKINLIIGPGGKKVRSIIEETGVEAIDTEDDGVVKITAKDLSSLEKSKAIISNLTMVPAVGDIYRNCEIKSIASYGVFVEIAPGREGLCHISELSSGWLAKAEDAVQVGDHVDVKLIEINDKGQLRLSRRALLPDSESVEIMQSGGVSAEATSRADTTEDSSDEESSELSQDKASGSKPAGSSQPRKKLVRRSVSPDKEKSLTSKVKAKRSVKAVSSIYIKEESSLVNGEAKVG